MTITVELPEEIELRYKAEASLRGISVEELVRDVVLLHQPRNGATPADLPAEEWVREFHAWGESHKDLDLPVLTGEDMSRETIYEDRGL